MVGEGALKGRDERDMVDFMAGLLRTFGSEIPALIGVERFPRE